MTHYVLTQMPRGAEAINRYVGAIAEGRPQREAFFAAFGQSPEDFDNILRAYVRRPSFAGTKFTFPEKVRGGEPGRGRVLSQAEAEAWLGDLQRRVGREAEATPRIDGAASPDSDAAITHLAAGLLRFSQNRTSEGLLEMDRAAALAPDDFMTQYLRGVWLARADLEGSAKQADTAAEALIRAVTLRPQSSDAYAWLAYAQMQKKSSLPDARRSIERAIELAPGRADYRLRWADVSILEGRYEDARKVLTALAELRTDPRSAEGAQDRLNRLEEFERAARSAGPFRRVRPGEQRVAGHLVAIECDPEGVRLHVDVGGQTIVTRASPLDAIELISYRDAKDLGLACGTRAQPDPVYITTADGIVVALEFLSKGSLPPR